MERDRTPADDPSDHHGGMMNGQQTDAQRLLFYLTMLQEDLTPELAELEKKALASDVPIVRKDTQMFLRLLLQMNRPKRILEIGTAVGFSALLMASYTSAETSIVTLENYQKRIALAKENIRSFGMEDRIRLIEGDAATTLQEMSKSGTEPFDFVFIDAAKAQYSVYFELLRSLTKSQSVIVSDNCLQDSEIIESHYAVIRRNRTIHKRMRDYLQRICHDEDYVSQVLPIGDGVAVCVRK